MIVEFNNFGHVRKTVLDLGKDFTVLCGPNNSGKTYIAYAVYGLMDFQRKFPALAIPEQILNGLLEHGSAEYDLLENLENNVNALLARMAKEFINELPKIFASDQKFFADATMTFTEEPKTVYTSLLLDMTVNKEMVFLGAMKLRMYKDQGSPVLKFFLEEVKTDKASQDIHGMIKLSLLSNIAKIVGGIYLGHIFSNTHFSTAERSAINLFAKELSLRRNELVDQMLEMKEAGKTEEADRLLARRASRYPLPIRDSLEMAEDLASIKRETSEYAAFADDIEQVLLKGKLQIGPDSELQFSPQAAGTLKLPIHLSASVVKSLSGLVVYLRHLAKPNDLVIIDEPELNLHPDNQVAVARLLARMANHGLKVMISTHSDYIIRELNNLIMAKAKPELAHSYGYQDDEMLDHSKVQALLFKDQPQQTICLSVDETGFEVETMDSVTEELNEKAQHFYYGGTTAP